MQLNVVTEKQVSASNGIDHFIGELTKSDDNDNPSLRAGLALRVASALQTTLVIEELALLFSQQIKPAVLHDRITFENSALSINTSSGEEKSFKCSYKLLLDGQLLGQVAIYRKWEFSKEDQKIFEYTLCSLAHPLRNALMYHEALQAAHKDALTGVNNRSAFDEILLREINLARRYNQPLSMIVLDIDNFKSINDKLGHASGDCVIRTIAELTSICIRNTDILFRYGGEEFVIMLSNTDCLGVNQLADRIRESIANTPIICEKSKVRVTVSLGTATLKNKDNANDIFARADKALYEAKNSGKNKVVSAELQSTPLAS